MADQENKVEKDISITATENVWNFIAGAILTSKLPCDQARELASSILSAIVNEYAVQTNSEQVTEQVWEDTQAPHEDVSEHDNE